MVKNKNDNMRDPLVSTVIDGYLVEELLGRGGMARVYRGVDVYLQSYVAIKVIDPRTRDDADYHRRFQREAQAIAQLRKHPNIVTIYRFGEVDGLYYMAMDYIDGPDLSKLLSDYRHDGELMPHDAVLRITTQIGKALDYAHKNDIIHRDVKPSNIMLNSDSDAILTDFGLALDTTEGTTGDVFGSPYYIAPEQAMSSAKVVPQTDLYSLGVTLYEMLTGSVPFKGDAMQIVMAHMAETPPAPQEFNPRLHKAFNPVLEKVLAKDPDKRYASGAKLAAALKAAIREAEEDNNATSKLRRVRPFPSPEESDMKLSTVELPEKVQKYRAAHPLPAKTTDYPVIPAKPDQSAQSQAAAPPLRRSRPRRVLLLLLLILLIGGAGAGAYIVTQTDLLDQFTTASGTSISLEGVVREIDAQSITIYDQRFLVDTRTLPEIARGDLVYIEGSYTRSGDTIRLSQVKVSKLN